MSKVALKKYLGTLQKGEVIEMVLDLYDARKEEETNEDTDRLETYGINICQKAKLSLCCAIIDRQTTWYGSVNILGYHSENDNLIRLNDQEIASALIEAMC